MPNCVHAHSEMFFDDSVSFIGLMWIMGMNRCLSFELCIVDFNILIILT